MEKQELIALLERVNANPFDAYDDDLWDSLRQEGRVVFNDRYKNPGGFDVTEVWDAIDVRPASADAVDVLGLPEPLQAFRYRVRDMRFYRTEEDRENYMSASHDDIDAIRLYCDLDPIMPYDRDNLSILIDVIATKAETWFRNTGDWMDWETTYHGNMTAGEASSLDSRRHIEGGRLPVRDVADV